MSDICELVNCIGMCRATFEVSRDLFEDAQDYVESHDGQRERLSVLLVTA